MILAVPDMSRGQPTSVRISEAIFTIVAGSGIDHATVREVARVAGVSIGTVQHHFPTKDAMLASAFTDVVRRVRARLETVELDADDVRRNVLTVLEQLLPLDRRRRDEARVQLAFAVRAMHEPSLAATQREVLGELHEALSQALGQAPVAAGPSTPAQARLAAHAVLALTDGLALHTLSAEDWLSSRRGRGALELVVSTLTAP